MQVVEQWRPLLKVQSNDSTCLITLSFVVLVDYEKKVWFTWLSNESSKHNNVMTFPPTYAYCYKPWLNFGKKSRENKGKEMTMLHPQRWLSSLIMFLLSSFMLKSDGSNHIVGDSSGWELYTNYTNWTQGREFHVGDVLGKISNSYTI